MYQEGLPFDRRLFDILPELLERNGLATQREEDGLLIDLEGVPATDLYSQKLFVYHCEDETTL